MELFCKVLLLSGICMSEENAMLLWFSSGLVGYFSLH